MFVLLKYTNDSIVYLCDDVSEHTISSIFMGGLSKELTSPMKMEQTECSGMSIHKIQTPGNHPKERTQRSERGEILKSSIRLTC